MKPNNTPEGSIQNTPAKLDNKPKKPTLDEDYLSAYLERDISVLYRTVFYYLSRKEAPNTSKMQIVHKVIGHMKNTLDQAVVKRIDLLGDCLKYNNSIMHKKQCILLIGRQTLRL